MIGQFGSGSKHGILTLLRLKIPFRVFVGQDELKFVLNGGKMLDKEYEEVRFVFKGEEHRTGTCLDFGALDWTKSDMALREFICNALDQGELIDNAVQTVSEVEAKPDETRIFVELVPDVVDYFTNLDVHFLHHRKQQNDSLLSNNTPDIRVYRKGVLVCAARFNAPALFHYNFTEGKIDESRNMDSANVSSLAARLVENDNKALSEIFGTFEQTEVWEHHVGSSVRYWQDPTKNAVRTAWKLAHGDKPFVGSTEMKERLAKKGIDSVVAPLLWTGVLEECKVPYGAGLFNALESSKLDSFPATEAACATFRRAWQWIKCANLTGGKDFPRIGCFSSDGRRMRCSGALRP